MIFRFVVAHWRWLARVPLMPQVFDAMLLTWTGLTDRRKLRAIERLHDDARRIFGATIRNHRFGGTEFWAAGRELGHVHGNGLFDASVGRASREDVVRSGLAQPHHVLPASGWVSLWIRDERDVPAALRLMQLAQARLRSRDQASQPSVSIE